MEEIMSTVTVSPKYQIVIPKELRESLGIRPGEKVQVFQYENRIEFVPVRKIHTMRGILKGINTNVDRDKDRV
jgi:AbrB family looped-hinge helix DNA binding protein